jgi:hypothetical protein
LLFINLLEARDPGSENVPGERLMNNWEKTRNIKRLPQTKVLYKPNFYLATGAYQRKNKNGKL